ncbi:thioesterase domain-containing protein [Micromonospora echinofusca]|uniref:4'-phosphopantetheinyl transferase superfamily protein n=1 Tax=Micromonospora echinofusca TaxID=47858 RepID=A0ABS3W280_MICEH|nr:thioesterase domain-containing protein [Micromonospora echinofusca]MBO4210724.1 4'-phosphopantetheinyl transferase superfamily protein [Micromonospora echinofusca]
MAAVDQLSGPPAGPVPTGHVTLLCLPYAGGDALAYWRWPELLPDPVRVDTVQLPGRDGRRPGTPGIDVGEVAARIAGYAHAPYALYGHSMGARLAFEVIRELRRTGTPLPVRLYVGGAHPPHLPEPITRLAHLTVDAFLDQLILRAGTPDVVRDDPDVRAAVLPTLRTDLDWLKRYRYHPAEPLPVPVVAFAGLDDREVPDDMMLGWARHTSASFRLHTLAGDHLFIRTAPQTVTALIAADLAAVRSAGPAALEPPAADEIHLWRVTPDRLPAVLRRYGADPDRSGPAGLRWSVSRSAGTAVVAVGGRDLGVDVETLRPVADFDAFCARVLTPAEWAEVLAEPEEHQLRAALRCWTAKEAVRKAADGTSDATGWQVTHLDLDGAVAAVATRGGRWRLRFETPGTDLR